MKKMLALAMILTTVLTLSACGGSSEEERVVNVCSWGEYIDDSLIYQFEDETGIKVNYQTAESNEALYSLLKTGAGDFDVIVPSDYMIARLIDEGMLAELNYDNIPNYALIDDAYKGLSFDPENKYTVPYTWGTVGIIYNTEVVTKPVTGWSILFDPDYAGQILMFDNSRDCLGIALKYLGYSYNTTDEAQITEAVDLLLQQKKDGLVQAYVMDQIFDKLEGGEAAIGPYYAGDFITMHEANPSLAFCLPEEGSNVFVDAMCIPKGAANKENAEAFINFMCSTEAGLANCEATGYSTPLLSVKEALPDEVKNDPVAYPDAEALGRCESFANLPEDTLALYDSEWLRLKTG